MVLSGLDHPAKARMFCVIGRFSVAALIAPHLFMSTYPAACLVCPTGAMQLASPRSVVAVKAIANDVVSGSISRVVHPNRIDEPLVSHWVPRQLTLYRAHSLPPPVWLLDWSRQGCTCTPFTFEPGQKFGEHTHPEDRMDAVVSGQLSFTMKGHEVILSDGDRLEIPRNVPHKAHVLGDKPLQFVSVVCPPFA